MEISALNQSQSFKERRMVESIIGCKWRSSAMVQQGINRPGAMERNDQWFDDKSIE